jgi:hypothetical protein
MKNINLRAGFLLSSCRFCGRFLHRKQIVIPQEKAPLRMKKTAHPPPIPDSICWDTLRGHFCMSFVLDPPAATTWKAIEREHSQGATGLFRSDNYLLKINEKETGKQTSLISYELTSDDTKPLQMLECKIECRTSYSGFTRFSLGPMCSRVT